MFCPVRVSYRAFAAVLICPRASSLGWCLIPSWSKDATIGQKLINARAETVAEKPCFPWAFKQRRCFIPASGFYESRKQRTGQARFLSARWSYRRDGRFEVSVAAQPGFLLRPCDVFRCHSSGRRIPIPAGTIPAPLGEPCHVVCITEATNAEAEKSRVRPKRTTRPCPGK